MKLNLEFLKEKKMNQEYLSVNQICHRLKEPRVDVVAFLKTVQIQTITIPFGNQKAVYYRASEIEPYLVKRIAAKPVPMPVKTAPMGGEQLARIENKLNAILRELNIKEIDE
jgi:hypothetical protein